MRIHHRAPATKERRNSSLSLSLSKQKKRREECQRPNKGTGVTSGKKVASVEKSYLKTTNTSQHTKQLFFAFFRDDAKREPKESLFRRDDDVYNCRRLRVPCGLPKFHDNKFLDSREMTSLLFVTFLKRIGKR